MAVQYAVTRVLSEARTVPEAGIRVLQTLCEKLEWEIGVFWILDQRAQVLRVGDVCHRGTIKRAEFVRACKTHTVHPGVGLPGRVWKSGEPAWIPDVMRDPDLPRAAAAAQEGLHSAFAFPIRVARTVHGVLEFFDHGIAQPGEALLETVADIGLKVGQFVERNRAEIVPHRAGQPRRYRRLISFDDLDDTDPVESSLWYDNLNPQLPRMLLRERFDRGGELAILRDISSSMAGVYSKWASSVILRLVELARKKRMRVGYIEFNHLSTKYQVEGKFFVRDYEKMSHRALNLHCSGCTN